MTALIAEIGLNHLGDEARARRMTTAVLKAGVDVVTFQVREPKFYESTEASHRRLSDAFYREAAEETHAAGRKFGIAICDEARIDGLMSAGVDLWKMLSWDFKNEKLRAALHKTGKSVFRSTGLSSMQEITAHSQASENSVLIHTQLSQALADVNLKAISTMGAATKLPIAFGLHCAEHSVLKVALGFEPHSMFFYVKEPGVDGLFDNEHALPLDTLAAAVQELKALAQTVGTGEKNEMKKPSWVVE